MVELDAPIRVKPRGEVSWQDAVQAFNAAVVRAINAGDYQRVAAKYFASHDFDSVAAFTCGLDESKALFPPAGTATGLLADVIAGKEVRPLAPCSVGSTRRAPARALAPRLPAP